MTRRAAVGGGRHSPGWPARALLQTAVAALVVVAPTARAEARLAGSARLWTGAGFDSNAVRDFTRPSALGTTKADAYLFALGEAEGVARVGPVRLLGGWDLTGRKYLGVSDPRTLAEDSVWLAMQGEATVGFLERFAVGVAGRLRDRHGGGRDYTDASGEVVVDFADGGASVRARVGARRFRFWPRFVYSFFGPEFGLEARYRFDRRHSVWLGGSYAPRTYNSLTNEDPAFPGAPMATRADSFVVAQVGYSYRGPFQVSASYAYVDQTSNSWGETWRRHRLQATAGFRLPWDFTLLASLALQLSSFPDGVFLSADLQVVNDDETGSSLQVKLVRPLLPWLELDLRYSAFVNYFPQNDFFYLRQLVSLGVSVALE